MRHDRLNADRWRELCAARMQRTLAASARAKVTRQYLATLPKRPPVVVSAADYLAPETQAERDERRYAEWVGRGKPSSTSQPRKDRRRPRAQERTYRSRLFEAQDGTCGSCGQPIDEAENGTLDHVVPRANGGSNGLANLLLMHWSCNNKKAAMPASRYELQRNAMKNARLELTETIPAPPPPTTPAA